MTMTTPSPPEITNVIVGTAGHIDHGKSSLVQRLTGIDPDRLQEEKDRGMTIDLGFARYHGRGDRLVGIIDVPGHERFIKNMVAGATSVDVVVLVVAADDGVMPQTREHLEILTLLGLKRGMVAVTKADLVDPELLELAIDDVRTLLADTFLADAPIVPCSNHSGDGIDVVREQLDELIAQIEPRSGEGLFRMAIQRVFSAKGHGTVVTGVPISGHVSMGDELEVLPLGRTGRVRGIQAYGTAREVGHAGHSCAVNLGDVDYREVCRGMVLATPDSFVAARLLEARMRHLPGRTVPLEHRTEIKFHVGTSELVGRVRILDADVLLPGEEALVQVELEEAVVVAAGDRFLVRRPSPAITVGGGVLFGAAQHHRKRLKSHHVEALERREQALADQEGAAQYAAEQRRFTPFELNELAVDLSRDRSEVEGIVQILVESGRLITIGRHSFLSRAFSDQARKLILDKLKEVHKAHPLKKLVEVRDLRSRLDLPEPVFKEVLARSVQHGAVCEEGAPGSVRLSSHQPALNEEDEVLLDEVRATYATAECSPPGLPEVAKKLDAAEKMVRRLVELLCDEGELVRVGTLFFHRPATERARSELIKNARAHGGEVAIPELRDILSTSRKYMIPLLESFDASGITVRKGDKRFLREHQVED